MELTYVRGHLVIVGTNRADQIHVDSVSVVLDGKSLELPISRRPLRTVYVDARGGDDNVGCDTSITLGQYPATLLGGSGNDRLHGGTTLSLTDGGGGNDIISGQDTLIGGDGNDRITSSDGAREGGGDTGDDLIQAGEGDDTIVTAKGNDTISGGSGNDIISTSGQEDGPPSVGFFTTVDAGDGHDRVTLERPANVTLGGGDDRLYFTSDERSEFRAVIFGSADAGAGRDWIQVMPGAHVDRSRGFKFSGGDGADTLIGSTGKDVISGDGGNDVIYGNSGNDSLYGGAGDDSLRGDRGSDRLDGEAGLDILRTVDNFRDILHGGEADGIDDVYEKDTLDQVSD